MNACPLLKDHLAVSKHLLIYRIKAIEWPRKIIKSDLGFSHCPKSCTACGLIPQQPPRFTLRLGSKKTSIGMLEATNSLKGLGISNGHKVKSESKRSRYSKNLNKQILENLFQNIAFILFVRCHANYAPPTPTTLDQGNVEYRDGSDTYEKKLCMPQIWEVRAKTLGCTYKHF